MDIRRTTPSRIFAATQAGAGLNFRHPCAHGDPSISLHFFSRGEDHVDDLGVLLPSCFAPDLFGAVLAYIEAIHGTQAGEKFLEEMLAAKSQGLERIEARSSQYDEARGFRCCTAASLTRGADHTRHCISSAN